MINYQTYKEPWQMTKAEYQSLFGRPKRSTTLTGGFSPHKEAVMTALNQGKPVSAEVLADYPDLAAKYGEVRPMQFTDPLSQVGPERPLDDADTAAILRLDAAAELDAINLYQSHIDAIADPELKRVIGSIRDDEKEHLAEFLAAVKKLDPVQSQQFEKYDPAPMPMNMPLCFGQTDAGVIDLERRVSDIEQSLSQPTGSHLRMEALPGSNPAEWVSGAYGSPGIPFAPERATSGPCIRLNLGPGHKPLVYAKGVIGALDEEQISQYCINGFEDREATPKQKARITAMSESANICHLEAEPFANTKEHLTKYFTCLGRELRSRGVETW